MSILNQNTIITLLKQGNPRAAAQQLIQTRYANDPLMQQVFQMGVNGNIQGLEQFARQYFSQQGRDFDAEFNTMMADIKRLQ